MATDLGTLELEVRADVDNLNKNLDKAESRTKSFNQSIKEGIGILARYGAVAGTAAGAVGSAATREFAQFEDAIIAAGTKVSATTETLERLEQAAISAGKKSMFSATQSANAMKFLGQAGFTASEQIKAVPGVLDLATASTVDLAQSADIASNILRGFTLDVEELDRVNNILVESTRSANVNVRELGQAMSFAAPIAENMGFSMEDTAAAIGIMQNAGIKATRAGRGLKNIFIQMTEASNKLEAGFSKSDLKTMDFVEALQELKDAGLGAGNTINNIFGRQAGPQLSILNKQIDKLGEFSEKLDNVGNVAEQVADKRLEGLSKKFDVLKGSIETAGIKIGEELAPELKNLTEALTEQANHVSEAKNSWSEFILQTAEGLGALSLAMSGLSLKALGFDVSDGFKRMRKAQESQRDFAEKQRRLKKLQEKGDIEKFKRIKEKRQILIGTDPITSIRKEPKTARDVTLDRIRREEFENLRQKRRKEFEKGGGLAPLTDRERLAVQHARQNIPFPIERQQKPGKKTDDDDGGVPKSIKNARTAGKSIADNISTEAFFKADDISDSVDRAMGKALGESVGRAQGMADFAALQQKANKEIRGMIPNLSGFAKLLSTSTKEFTSFQKKISDLQTQFSAISSVASPVINFLDQVGRVSGSKGVQAGAGVLGAGLQGTQQGISTAGSLAQAGATAGLATGLGVGAGIFSLAGGILSMLGDDENERAKERKRRRLQKRRQERKKFRNKLSEQIAENFADEMERRQLQARVIEVDARGSMVGSDREVARRLGGLIQNNLDLSQFQL